MFVLFRLFSPYRLVIEIRSELDPPSKCLSFNACATPVADPPDGCISALPKQNGREDHIEKSFGDLENAFTNSIREPSQSKSSIRSRDDSIRLLYDVQNSSDWLNLVEGHDSHVCLPNLFTLGVLTKTISGAYGVDETYTALYL